MDFTPKQLHYFKRELITQQLEKEISLFVSNPDVIQQQEQETTAKSLPFLTYIFKNLISEFPLLKHTGDEQFWSKCRVFMNEFNKIQLASFYTPRTCEGNLQRKAMQAKIQKLLVFAFCASIKTKQGQEENIRINAQTIQQQVTLDNSTLQPTPPLTSPTNSTHNNPSASLFKVNIVTVREIKTKRTIREVSHAEFIIETYLPGQPEAIYVGHRHGDFRKLRDHLKRHFKHTDLPLVPAKSTHHSAQTTTSSKQAAFYRENDRLLLRAFLHHLVGKEGETINRDQQQIRNSHVLRKFLTERPVVFTSEEEEDAVRREEADHERWIEQAKFQRELDKRVHELNDTLECLKRDILKRGGLPAIFDTIKHTKSIEDLPDSLKKALEWGRINFAFALHKQFITADTATENLTNLKRTHGLMPYRTMALILRFSNPMSMIKSILDLFLAQPFGGRSLFQRMLISNLNEEVRALEKQIHVLQKKINDKNICQKLHNAVRTKIPIDSNFRGYETRVTELMALLADDHIEPALSTEQLTKIVDFESSHETKKWMKHINELWELYARQYEQELMISLVFQGITGDLLKEFIAVFYQPLAQVYKAADISTTIKHVSAFIDDLIQVVDNQLLQQQQDSVAENDDQTVSNTIQLFIDLVQRHEQHFYDFVHNVHTQEASRVFDELIQYLDTLFGFMAQGIPGQIDLNDCVQRAGILPFNGGLDSLKNEINAICEYRYKQKMYHFERQRRKMMARHGPIPVNPIPQTTEESKDNNNDNDLLQYVFKSNEMMMDDLEEFAYEDTDSSSNSSNGSDDSNDSLTSGSSIGSRRSSNSSSSNNSQIETDKPLLEMIPKITPFFVQDVIYLMNQY
ncbi:MAG: hypothetical protein EXX96DRAFT_41466 [Benjaminiella poitrasii]|nr:MAG: hypothetical protein EXX96DRAFT_41466 [Benjaminiella poitrasii]